MQHPHLPQRGAGGSTQGSGGDLGAGGGKRRSWLRPPPGALLAALAMLRPPRVGGGKHVLGLPRCGGGPAAGNVAAADNRSGARAWDFEPERESQKKLDWIDESLDTGVEPISQLGVGYA